VGLWLDESLISGESLPVRRERPGERVLAGSLVTSGRGLALVQAVGEASELGRLGRDLRELRASATPLQRRARRLTGQVTAVALGLCALLTLLQASVGGEGPRAVLAGLALALALLPNEIPVVVSLFLALGALRLSRIGVLARWPATVESLGSTTVLAVDKTGTLTQNRMAVQALLTWPQQEHWQTGSPLAEPWHRLLEQAVLASRHDPVDAMEQANQRLARQELEGSEHLHPDWPLLHDYPLRSDLLVVSKLWRDAQGRGHLAAKGAPEAIADLCHLDATARSELLGAAERLALSGLRVLAVAVAPDGLPRHAPGRLDGSPEALLEPPEDVHDLDFAPVGLLALADPLRPEVPAAIARARRAEVRVLMISGDGPVTARAIADQAGLPPGPVVCGDDPAAWEAALQPSGPAGSGDGGVPGLRGIPVFARVMPQQKLALVRALQASGEVVAMGGDGVNDAAALRAADIGVAMGRRGTAVAREAADLVLLHDRFGDLVEALALGRRVEANLQRALTYTLAIHLPIALLALLPLLWNGATLILLPVHIALLHLVIDPACTVVFEALPGDPALMERPPRRPQAPLLTPRSQRLALRQGIALALAAAVLLCWPDLATDTRRSLVFALLLLGGGTLVWINGGRSGRTAAGPLLGLSFCTLLALVAPLRQALALGPMVAQGLLLLTATLVPALGAAALAARAEGGGDR
ncbi:MAG: HAD-IC family P-type ATPase, partial [Cyanobium sp.]